MRRRLSGHGVPPQKLNRTPGWACLALLVSVWSLAHQNQVQVVHLALIELSMAGYSRISLKMVMTRMTSIVLCKTICESFKSKQRVRWSLGLTKRRIIRPHLCQESKVAILCKWCRLIPVRMNSRHRFRRIWTKSGSQRTITITLRLTYSRCSSDRSTTSVRTRRPLALLGRASLILYLILKNLVGRQTNPFQVRCSKIQTRSNRSAACKPKGAIRRSKKQKKDLLLK